MPKRVRAAFGNGPLCVERVNGGSPLTAMGWEVDPDSLHSLIVRVDYETQRRIPKRSGLWYRPYIARARNGG